MRMRSTAGLKSKPYGAALGQRRSRTARADLRGGAGLRVDLVDEALVVAAGRPDAEGEQLAGGRADVDAAELHAGAQPGHDDAAVDLLGRRGVKPASTVPAVPSSA
jgi:hypothetical protein